MFSLQAMVTSSMGLEKSFLNYWVHGYAPLFFLNVQHDIVCLRESERVQSGVTVSGARRGRRWS